MRKGATDAGPTFAMTVEEIRNLATRIMAYAEDYMGIDRAAVSWGNVADADLALAQLRNAARTMGIEVDR